MRRYLAPFRRHLDTLLTSVRFHDVRRCNVIFLTSTTSEMHVNVSVTVKTVGGIFVFAGGKFEDSEGYNSFFAVFYVLEAK